MKPRKVDLAFEWMQGQPRRAYHYRDEVWAALAEFHPGEFGVSDERKTPWFSLHRDMTQDRRFLRGDRGMFELANPDAPDVSTQTGNDPVPLVQESQVWIFQSNPKFYRFLEALQKLDRMQFLTNRYKNRIKVGDIVLLWMSGNHAGIYAQGSGRPGSCRAQGRRRRRLVLGRPERRLHGQATCRSVDRAALPRQPSPERNDRGYRGAGQVVDSASAQRHELPSEIRRVGTPASSPAVTRDAGTRAHQ